jgi:8-oxo-dGTP pyrophosphatase MutT (NUDIX family)
MKQDTDITRGRAELLEALQDYLRRFPSERAVVDRMIDFLLREAGCFERATLEGHFTGSAWIVHPTSEQVLLTHHRKLNKWLQLGGHADGVENLLTVALSEAHEESGIDGFEVIQASIYDVDIHVIPARKSDPEHLHYDVRYLFRAQSDHYIISNESHDLAWVAVSDIALLTSEESMLRMANKWNVISRR